MQDAVLSHHRNIYSAVTEKIVEAMNAGAGSFKMPWHTAGVPVPLPTNAATDAKYRGINIVTLWAEALDRSYLSGEWASYRQWQTLGAQVRQGERGTTIVFYKKMEADDDGVSEAIRFRHMLKSSKVFNGAQVDGWTPPASPLCAPTFEIDKEVEAFVRAIGVRVRHGFAMARYRLDLDDIEMPSPAWFTGTATSSASQSYHAVLLHETTHWSGASHRLDRAFGKRFGDQAYAFEELVAELGAAFLCATLGIANEPRADHAAYLSSWLEVLKSDHKAIFTAANLAQQAAEYLGQLAAANVGA